MKITYYSVRPEVNVSSTILVNGSEMFDSLETARLATEGFLTNLVATGMDAHWPDNKDLISKYMEEFGADTWMSIPMKLLSNEGKIVEVSGENTLTAKLDCRVDFIKKEWNRVTRDVDLVVVRSLELTFNATFSVYTRELVITDASEDLSGAANKTLARLMA